MQTSIVVLLFLVLVGVVFFVFNPFGKNDPGSAPPQRVKTTRGNLTVSKSEKENRVRWADSNHTKNYVKGSAPSELAEQNSYETPLGPFLGEPMGVPVQAGSLRETNEDFRGIPGWGSPYRREEERRSERLFSFPSGTRNNPGKFFRPFGKPDPRRRTGFYGRASAFSPYPEVATKWEKVGLLTTTDSNGKGVILNLFRRPIAPLHEVWEYRVEDRDGFFIELPMQKELRDGDEIPTILGKGDLGPWKVSLFVKNKWIWV